LTGALALYSPSLNGPFVFDGANVVNGSLLHITSLGQLDRVLFAEGVPRRIGLASFALNFYLDGLRPFGYHLVNVLLHGLNAFLLYWLGRAVLDSIRSRWEERARNRLIALAAAWLWMVHPLQTQAVSYVYQRFTVLSASFFLLSLCFWVAARQRTAGWRVALYAASFASGLLALGTKEIAATLPLMLLALELGILRERPFSWRRREAVIAGLCLTACLVIAAVYLGANFVPMMADEYARRGFTLGERLLTEARVVVHYLSLLLFPHPSRLTLDYDFPLSTGLLTPPSTLAAISGIAALLVASAVRARQRPLFFLAVLWFFGNLAVESTVVPLDLVYEHRVYLPSMMLFLFFTAAMLGRQRFLSSAMLVLLAGVFSLWTYQRNRVWGDAVALWEDNVQKSPEKARVHGNLGSAYLASGRPAEARRAFEKAIELDPSLVAVLTSLANLHIDHTQEWSEAGRLLDEVLERAPDYAPAYVSLGVISLRRGELSTAAGLFEKALDLDERDQAALYNLGAVHFNRKDYAAAAAVLEEGASYWPANAGMHALRGAALVEMGRGEEALESLHRALALDPANPMAKRYRTRVIGTRGSRALSRRPPSYGSAPPARLEEGRPRSSAASRRSPG
jgi:tetratricopeptide (TPR) repeat protein